MSRAGKTIRQRLGYRPEIADWFGETQALFNRVAAFYFDLIESHREVLSMQGNGPRDTLERLTHRTKSNPDPPTPLDAVADNLPALMRRAAIQAALGAAYAFHSNLARWQKEKERALSSGKKFKKRPPAPPRSLEQVGHLLCRHVEGAHRDRHAAQALDGDELVLGEGAD